MRTCVRHCVACLMSVFSVHLCCSRAQPHPAGVTVKRWVQTSPSEEDGVSRQAAGYPITLGLLLRPLPASLPSNQIQERSGGVKQAPPSVIILPSPAVLSVLTTELSFLSLYPLLLTPASTLYGHHPFSFSSCLTLPFMIFTPPPLHLLPSRLSFLVSFCSFDSPASLLISLCHFLSQI